MTLELSEVLQRDPLTFTKDDEALTVIIKGYRDKRHQFNLGDIKAGSVKPRSVKPAVGLADVLNAGGSDLDLKI